MTIETTTFEIFSSGKNDIIDITPKIEDAIKNHKDIIVFVSVKDENCAIIQFKEDKIKKFLEYFNQTIDNSIECDINQFEDCINFKSTLKSLILGKSKMINPESLINKDEKILFLDFSMHSSKKQVTIKIIY